MKLNKENQLFGKESSLEYFSKNYDRIIHSYIIKSQRSIEVPYNIRVLNDLKYVHKSNLDFKCHFQIAFSGDNEFFGLIPKNGINSNLEHVTFYYSVLKDYLNIFFILNHCFYREYPNVDIASHVQKNNILECINFNLNELKTDFNNYFGVKLKFNYSCNL